MAENLQSDDYAEEDFIDMEVSSHVNFPSHSLCSPPFPREFEFQMSSSSSERNTTTSAADELFYKGKLLPLHLPPRLEMVEKLLCNSTSYENKTQMLDEFFSTPLTVTANTCTPYESCNISPSESCQVSRELNPGEYFFEYSTEASNFIDEYSKKSWTRKLKLIKQSLLSSKLKASRAYLKSFFGISGCSVDSCTASSTTVRERTTVRKVKERVNQYRTATKMALFGQNHKDRCQMSISVARDFDEENITHNGGDHHRSLSEAIKRIPISISSSESSSSISSNSNEFHKSQYPKRSGTEISDIENSIQAAITHCKKSQKQFFFRQTGHDNGFCALSVTRIVCEDPERQGLCRG